MIMTYGFEMPQTTGPLHERRESRRIMAEQIERMSEDTGYKFGPRGWAYYAEGLGLITKGEFARFEKLLTDMRKAGERTFRTLATKTIINHTFRTILKNMVFGRLRRTPWLVILKGR